MAPNPSTSIAPTPVPSATDEYALMEAVRGKDSAAFSTLYDRYSQTIYALCLRALRDPGEAEDLLIDIFYEMWDRADRYDPARSSPTSYVMGVARSRVVDRLRSLKSRRRISAGSATVVLEALPDASPSAAPPGEAIELAERRMRIVLAMRTLSPPQRQALEMAFFDSMTHAEVAEALKEPVGTIKSRIRQALIQLRKALGSEP